MRANGNFVRVNGVMGNAFPLPSYVAFVLRLGAKIATRSDAAGQAMANSAETCVAGPVRWAR